MHEEVEHWIETTNLDENAIKVLAMLEQNSSPLKFGHGVLEGLASTLRKQTHSELVNALNGRWLGL